MATPVIKPASVPGDSTLPATAQQLINFVAAYLTLHGLNNLEGIIVDDAEPAVADRDKAWLKLDAGSGRAIGLFHYSGGWQQIPVVAGSGESEPANPRAGELFYNTAQLALKGYIDGAWTTELWAKGDTSDRPENPPIGFVYFDTDIKRLIRYTADGWSTVDGCIGEIRMFDGMSTTEAEERNPGWVIHVAMGGRVPLGQNDDYAVGVDGGRKSVAWSAKSLSAHGGSREQGLISEISIDGEKLTGSSGTTPGSKEAEFDILPPYRGVIFMRKEF